MATKYVATTGSNAADGSLATPWQTLAYGFANISANDVLEVRGGTYAGDLEGTTLPSGTNDGTRTIVRNYTGETVIINGFNRGIRFADAVNTRSFITFDGLIFDGEDQLEFATDPGVYVSYNSSYITFQNCIIRNWQHGDGISFANGLNGNSDNCRVINCTVHTNGDPTAPLETAQQHGIYCSGTNQLFDGNTVYNNAGYGIHIYYGTVNHSDNTIVRNNRCYGNGQNPNWGSGELLASWGDDMKVYNNVCYYNASGLLTSYGMITINGGDNIQVYNNTCYGGPLGESDLGIGVGPSCTNAVVKNNISYGSDDNYDDQGSGTIESNNLFDIDPDFVNAAGFNFDLASTSDAINAGMDASAILTTDIIGTERPQSTAFDIGAYEYIFPPDPPIISSSIIGIVGGL